jgi:hypothetical protein
MSVLFYVHKEITRTRKSKRNKPNDKCDLSQGEAVGTRKSNALYPTKLDAGKQWPCSHELLRESKKKNCGVSRLEKEKGTVVPSKQRLEHAVVRPKYPKQ